MKVKKEKDENEAHYTSLHNYANLTEIKQNCVAGSVLSISKGLTSYFSSQQFNNLQNQ